MNLPNLHDWEIKAIITDYDEQLVIIQLQFLEANGNLTLKGVSHFHASNMMLQNVILDVLIFETAIKSNYFDYCKNVLHIGNDFFNKNKNIKILYIEPSVGVELVCSFIDIEFNLNTKHNI